jgi:peptide/nickel transport system substrate-binding protein
MRIVRNLALAATTVTAMATSFSAVEAATPKDTLVMADTIDDTLSLDPAEIFEFTGAEVAGNTYEQLTGYDVKDVSKIHGEIAESWAVSPDGRKMTFKVRQNKKFASGNPVTAEDVVFSLHRAVILDKSPAFILGQFGLTKDNVKDKVKQTGPFEFTFELDKPYAPSFVLYCLTATVASVVDKKLAMQHEKDGDLGYSWLKTNYAGSGPFKIREWKANEAIVLERNDNHEPKAPLTRVIYRHIKETAAQRLLLEKGDIDIARKLGPEELEAVSKNSDVKILTGPKGTVWYLGLNQKNPNLAKPEVRQALKYLVDYSAIADTVMKHKAQVHQAFLPKGFLGALSDTPYKLDVAKAKELLAKAGLPNGFTVTMDTRSTPENMGIAQAVQQTFAQAGVRLEILPADGRQVLTKYRARQHDIIILNWGSDYQDPNSNADTFSANDDNSDDAKAKPLAWRNAWDPGPLTQKTRAAVLERDTEKRAAMYDELQRAVMQDSPFVIMFQQIEPIAMRKNVEGFILGPSFDSNLFGEARKN